MPLEDFYAGDDVFHRFAMACAAEWGCCDQPDALLRETGGDLDLAMALHYHLGGQALGWLDQAVPALDDLTPRECLKTAAGRRRVRECLLRMP
jgi:hypothetical protein